MGEIVSIRDKMIEKVVRDLYHREDGKYPVEIISALASLMKDGKVDFVRRDGEWAFYLSTKDY